MAKTTGVDAGQLKAFIDRIERLVEEMANIRSDIREIYAEAKDFGYDPKVMRAVLAEEARRGGSQRARRVDRDLSCSIERVIAGSVFCAASEGAVFSFAIFQYSMYIDTNRTVSCGQFRKGRGFQSPDTSGCFASLKTRSRCCRESVVIQ